MHLRLLLLSVVPSMFAAAAALGADPIKADSSISAVTVYVDRAIVARTARVELPEGTQEILFAGLPASLDPDLLQVAGGGTAEAMILDVRAVSAQLEVAANPRMKELQERLRALQNENRALTDRAAVLQAQRDFLERVKVAATTPVGGKDGAAPLPTVDQWERLVVFYGDGLAKLSLQIQEIDRAKEDLLARVSAVQRELAELQPQSAKAVQNVFVRVDVTKAGPLDVRLEYTVADASWAPTYDVRVTAAEKMLSLGYSAMVRQSTGEDWHAVKLTLSTARPAIGGTPPELSPWFVKEYDRQAAEEARSALIADSERRKGSRLARQDAPAAAGAMEMDAFKVEAAVVTQGLTAATFTLTRPADVPADNAEHKIGITTHPLAAELTHLSVPKLAELAYLRAAVVNTSGYPLISGPVNMYLDGTFVARSQLKTVMPDEKFDLDLGVDDGVSVKRKLLNRLTEDTGIVSRKQEITYDVVITVQNNRTSPVKLIVKDQLPVSQHERITVELVEPPSRVVKKDDDGTLTWTLDLAPGEKRELPLKIAVEYPADLPVEGLE